METQEPSGNQTHASTQETTPWLGKVFAVAMLALFIMVILGVLGVYWHQKNAPQPQRSPLYKDTSAERF